MSGGRPASPPSAGGFLLAKVHQVSGRVFARLLREAGDFPINPAQGRILFALWRAGRPLPMGELAAETALEPSTLTSMLDRLEAAGLARRSPSPSDRRVVLVERGEADRALEERYAELSARMTGLFYGDLGEAEVAAFEASLERILANLEKAERELRA
ncbi:MAG TPA: MarR family transcriptional regulator [Spirochaetia bacterium]|nr:MarR family transcriptional regulator [Spirochaetia bacterium]HRZ66058.1 MarR family transcriptional regulator [Spirochaetia bacterium]